MFLLELSILTTKGIIYPFFMSNMTMNARNVSVIIIVSSDKNLKEDYIMVEWYGALVGLALTIFLILKKTPVFYGMLAGALVGGLVGGLNIQDTVTLMVDGAKGV